MTWPGYLASMDVIDDDSVNPGIKPHGHRRHQAMPATHSLAWSNASGGGGFSGSTRTSWNLTRHTSSSSPANPQPASPEAEGCSSRFSEIWQSRHTLPMVRASRCSPTYAATGDVLHARHPSMQRNGPDKKNHRLDSLPVLSGDWCLRAQAGTSYRHRLSATAAGGKKTMWLQRDRDGRGLVRHPCPPRPARSRMPSHDKEPCLIAEPEGRRVVSAGDPRTWNRPPRCP